MQYFSPCLHAKFILSSNAIKLPQKIVVFFFFKLYGILNIDAHLYFLATNPPASTIEIAATPVPSRTELLVEKLSPMTMSHLLTATIPPMPIVEMLWGKL